MHKVLQLLYYAIESNVNRLSKHASELGQLTMLLVAVTRRFAPKHVRTTYLLGRYSRTLVVLGIKVVINLRHLSRVSFVLISYSQRVTLVKTFAIKFRS